YSCSSSFQFQPAQGLHWYHRDQGWNPFPDEPVASTSSNTRKREKKTQKTPGDGPKKARYCSACKNPMKGHKNIEDCPNNKK
ncbi:unnamed protein product, partial [Porites lobata]